VMYTCRIPNSLLANMPVGLTIPISEAYVLDGSPNVLDSQNFWSGLQIHSIALVTGDSSKPKVTDSKYTHGAYIRIDYGGRVLVQILEPLRSALDPILMYVSQYIVWSYRETRANFKTSAFCFLLTKSSEFPFE
jgi:hypothetical protein